MSFWTSLKNAFRRPNPRHFVPFMPSMPDGMHALQPEQALQLSVVWACVDVITRAISSCPWRVYTLEGTNRKYLPSDSLDYILNVRPNDDMTAMAFRESILYSALTYGNGFAIVEKDDANRVKSLYPLEPDRTSADRDEATGRMRYVYKHRTGGELIIPREFMYHLRGPTLNGLLGENMVVKMARSLALTRAAETFATSYFANNTIVGGVLEYPGKLDEKAYDRLATEWKAKRQGPEKAYSAVILEGGMKFQSIANDPAASQLIESRKFQVLEICRWFGVPPHKVFDLERATFSNIEHQSIEFTRDALTPWAVRMAQEADWVLTPIRGPGSMKRTQIDLTALAQGDFKSRAEGYQIMRRIGVYSANDIRAREGDNSIGPEGDIRIVETNMQPLDMVEDRAEAEVEKLKEKPEQKALPPAAEPEEEGGEVEDEALMTNVATLALQAFFENALERHRKRVTHRIAELKAKLRNGELGAKTAEALAKSRDTFNGDFGGTIKTILDRYPADLVERAKAEALEKVESGIPPGDAAAHLAATVVGGVQ